MLKFSALVAALALTGCASITGKQLQPLSVSTVFNNQEVSGVSCTLSNDVGTWFLTSPATATVHKSTADLVVDCKRDALSGNSRLESGANLNVWGNVLIGGIIGYVVDRQTGAGFDYPNAVTVMLRQAGDSGLAPVGSAVPVTRTTAGQTATQAAPQGRTVAGAPQ